MSSDGDTIRSVRFLEENAMNLPPRAPRMVPVIGVVLLLAAPARSASAAIAEDEKAVAALDKQYQAAVAKNDAVTMDRILADDFILVTGKGKVFTKADLPKAERAATTT